MTDELARLSLQYEEQRTSKQWEGALETLKQMFDAAPDSAARAGWYHAAGLICRDELSRRDEALDHFDYALDSFWCNEPADMTVPKARAPFDAIVRMHQEASNWKSLDRTYRKMIQRIKGYERFNGFQADLFWKLGDLYRGHLKWEEPALTCFEEARKLDAKAEDRAELRRQIDEWVAGGGLAFEPALGLLAMQTFPPDVSVFDDAIARARYPRNAKLYLDRAMLLMGDFSRQADHLADLQRAFEYSEDRPDVRSMAARTMAQHHEAFFDDYTKAIELIQVAIELNKGDTDDARMLLAFDRGMLANWLEKRGDLAAALAIRTDLAATAEPTEKYRQLKAMVDLHAKGGDWDSVEEVCKTMTDALETTAEAWLKLLEEDSADRKRIDRILTALAATWSNGPARSAIQRAVRHHRSMSPALTPLLDATFIPLANAGLVESREVEDSLRATPDALAEELTRRGDARGELISVQRKLEAAPGDFMLTMRHDEIIRENAFRLLGPLDPTSVTWRHGYVTHATHMILKQATLVDIAWIASHPSLRFLEQLTLQLSDDPIAALLGAADGLRRIPTLVVAIWTPRTEEQRAQVAAALPNLTFSGL